MVVGAMGGLEEEEGTEGQVGTARLFNTRPRAELVQSRLAPEVAEKEERAGEVDMGLVVRAARRLE